MENDIVNKLKQFLEDNNLWISFECSECSDLYGISSPEIVVSDLATGKNIVSVSGYSITSDDIN